MCFVTLQFTLQCAKHTVAVKVFTAAEANYIERVNEESTDLVSIWELCQSETCCNFTVIQSNLFKVYINLFTCAHTQPFQTVFLPTSDRLCNRHSCLCYLAEVFFLNLILEHDVKISTFHREKKLSRNCAIKVLNHAMTGVDGVDNSQKFVDILGLRTIFPLFMKTPKSSKAGPASDELEGMQHFFFFPSLNNVEFMWKKKIDELAFCLSTETYNFANKSIVFQSISVLSLAHSWDTAMEHNGKDYSASLRKMIMKRYCGFYV